MNLVLSSCLIFAFLINGTISQSLNGFRYLAPIVKTTYGLVQGDTTKTRDGRTIIEFLAMPYAKAPINQLRFKSPEISEPWKGVRNATKEAPTCIQEVVLLEASRNIVSGSEDCLYLNVFTPTISPWAKLPVFVLIHGGAYMATSSAKATYGPDLLLDKNIVLVTFNFRLGPLGFLSTADDVIPGNLGMKDQVMALKWVNDNIGNFGGDTNSITLMGESSGGSSVHLHMLSPVSQDLFHKGIIQSGSAFCSWAYTDPKILKDRAAALAQYIGCPFTPSSDFLACLRNLPAEKIVGASNRFMVWDIDPLVIWTPTIEPITVQDAFLTKSPRRLYATKPLLAGFNFAEGGLKTYSMLHGNVQQKFQQWNDQFDTLTPFSLIYNSTAPDPASVTKAIRSFYFGPSNQPMTPQMITQITQLYTDAWFSNCAMDAVSRHRGISYLYYFNYNSSVSLCSVVFTNPKLYLGACHLDELAYMFPMLGTSPQKVSRYEDYKFSHKLMNMWTNFARYSNPSTFGVMWNPVQSSNLEYLEITNSGFVMKSNPIKERRAFWKSLKLRTCSSV